MREIVMAILITACLLSGLLLRYDAIAPVVLTEKKRTLVIWYTAALVLHAIGLSVYFSVAVPTVGAAKNSGVLFAMATTIINMLVVRDHVREHLFAFGIVIVCNYLLMALPSYTKHLLAQSGVSVGGFGNIGMYALLLALTFLPIRKMLRSTVRPFLTIESGSYWDTAWVLPVSQFVLLLLTFPGNKPVEQLSSILGGILCAGVMILICWRSAASYKEMLEKQHMESQLAGQKLYYAKLQAKVEEARKTGHDFKHYAQAMRHYLSTDDIEGLRICCIELTQQLNRVADVHDVGNSLADGVLFQYLEQARKEAIEVKIQGELNCDWISDMDICVILGNLLDNAIEGCKTMKEDRRLSVNFQHTDTTVCLLVQNTFDGQVAMDHGEMVSRKREQISGVGLKSVETLCQKYDGEMDVCPDKTLFSVNLLLKKPQRMDQ